MSHQLDRIHLDNSIKNYYDCQTMRDKIGGRPFEVKNEGGKKLIKFFPMSENAQNPDLVLFRITLDKNDIKKLTKALS